MKQVKNKILKGMQLRSAGPMTREIHTPEGVRIRATEEGGSRTIEGTAIVFGRESVALYSDETVEIREVISREAVTEDLLQRSTILMTLYHDNTRMLARSQKGRGSLHYELREDGVHFSFDAPETVDGDTALALVSRGDITGCSFAFRANYDDPECVTRDVQTTDGKRIVTYTVKRMEGIYDFTLTPMPAYPQTEVGKKMRDQLEAEDRAAKEERDHLAESEKARKATIRELREKSGDINF